MSEGEVNVKKPIFKKWWFWVIAIVVVVAIAGSQSETTTESSSNSPITKIDIPADQQNFINAVKNAKTDYASASNELKKTAVRRQRSGNIQKALNGGLAIKNWVGRVKDMSTTTKGNAYLSISLEGANIRIQTWNNELSDLVGETLIKSGSNLYNKVAEFDTGDLVKFSGSFVSGDNYFVEEQSMTENGAMENPEFTFIFQDINKI